MELRSAQYICAGEISSRDPSKGSQGLQKNFHKKKYNLTVVKSILVN